MLSDVKASVMALCYSQNLRGEGDVHQRHVRSKMPKHQLKHLLFRNSLCRDERRGIQ